MLDQAHAEQFSPLVGQTCTLTLPDGNALPVQVEEILMRERSRNPYAKSARTPFTLCLIAQDNNFIAGTCRLGHQGSALLEDAYASRVIPAGRDPSLAYYEIVFN